MNHEYRLSDDERTAAMAALGRAMSEGRLSVDEYDARCQTVTKATLRKELEPLFSDLPQTPVGSSKDPDVMYSAQEVAAAHKGSRNVKFGLMSLTTVGSIAAVPILASIGVMTPGWSLVLIPIVFILLYILKIGPAKWHTPSPRQIHRQRLREIQSAEALRSAERKAEDQARLAELRSQRQLLAGELTNEAMGIAKRSIDKFKK